MEWCTSIPHVTVMITADVNFDFALAFDSDLIT